MKRYITLERDSDLLRAARKLAAEKGLLVSGLLAAKAGQIAPPRRGYQRCRRRAWARLRKGFDLGSTAPRSRDELHDW